jgi:2-oxoglutarate ferredoxin oxidoreductase subunit alpha
MRFPNATSRVQVIRANPLEDGTLDNHIVIAIEINKLTNAAVADCDVSSKEATRCKNFWALLA